jgi:hypothetical protein
MAKTKYNGNVTPQERAIQDLAESEIEIQPTKIHPEPEIDRAALDVEPQPHMTAGH